MRKLTALATTLGATAVLTASVAGVALADPPSGTTPTAADVVGTGSDTVQGLFDAFSAATISKNFDVNSAAAGTQFLYSYDATTPGTNPPTNSGDSITPKAGGATIVRPNGSGKGIAALEGNTVGTVDFARASRARQATDPTDLSFVQYAADAVTVADGTANGVTNAPSNLDDADLKAIYRATSPVRDFSLLPDNPTSTSNPIHPFLPQGGSGTRLTFLAAIGLTESTVDPSIPISQENQGNAAALQNDPDILYPYSVGVALTQIQGTGGNGSDVGTTGTLTFKQVDGKAPAVKSGGKYVINTSFPRAYIRYLYDVVRTDSTTTDGIPAYLEGLFGSNGAICTKGASLIQAFNFVPLSKYNLCGVVS